MVDVSEIEKRIDRVITSAIPVNTHLGGIDPKDYGQVMEFAKTMATARHSIPQWLRGSVGDCLAICSRALRWGFDPYFVAEKSFLMEGKSGTKVGYESQLIHAIVEALAPLKGRLRHRYEGEDDATVCIVWGTFKGEDSPHEYISVPLGKRIKDIGQSDRGNFRGSPMWLQKPRLQLFYDASRDWARINCPDVLAGVYAREELTEMEPVDVTPKDDLAERLKATRARFAAGERGFDADHVAKTASARSIIEGEINSDPPTEEAVNVDNAERSGDEPGAEGGGGGAASAADDTADQGGGADVRGAGGEDGGEPVGHEAEEAQAGEGDSPDDKPASKKGRRR